MEKEMLGNLFKYENNMLYKINKRTKKWSCLNVLKPNSRGYNEVTLNGKTMKLHRLVYLFDNPNWNIHDSSQNNSIDHINQDKLDNRIQNLRVATHSQNQQNTTNYGGKPKRGVCFHKQTNKWTANYRLNGKQINKYFKTEQEAIEYRKKMVSLHYI